MKLKFLVFEENISKGDKLNGLFVVLLWTDIYNLIVINLTVKTVLSKD
jgi:hypothetical protein